jgi:type VI secretion system protein ImpH
MGTEAGDLAFLAALALNPHQHDFYQTLRRLECADRSRPRWGCAVRPAEEPVRLGQDPDLSFAPSPLASFAPADGEHPGRLQVRLFGLLGPNGPLPIHITESARERLRHHGDPALSRFLDLFHHRFLALFYRAWAQAQPHVNRDRPDDDRFASFVGAFIGLALPEWRSRGSLPDDARLFHAGALMGPVRNADGLAGILTTFFGVPASLEQFVGHWLTLDARDHTRLAAPHATLGTGATLGGRVWDRQHKIRVRLGALTIEQYTRFLPGGALLAQLTDWMRLYFDGEFAWDVQLVLQRTEVPPLRIGSGQRLGWTTWLGTRAASADADDLCVAPVSFV